MKNLIDIIEGTVLPDTSKKRALIINFQTNQVEVSDCEAFSSGLREAGFSVERYSVTQLAGRTQKIKTLPIEEYSFIGFTPSFNGMFHTKGGRKDAVLEIIKRAKPGALSLIVCDTTLAIDPHMWNDSEGSSTKVNILKEAPFKIIGSFSDSILSDKEAMEKVQKMWLNKSHDDSEFLPLEWLAFHIDSLECSLKGYLSEGLNLLDSGLQSYTTEDAERLEGFYYGVSKPKVAASLKDMGLGINQMDSVFGTISKNFPELKNYDNAKDNRGRTPTAWAPLVHYAKEVYLPNDPVKGNHQFTKRFLEYAILCPDRVKIDKNINPKLLMYLDKENWTAKSKEVSSKLGEIYGQ